MKTSIIKSTFLVSILLANVGCDQITKHIAREQLVYNKQTEIIGSFLSFIKIENTGAFMSLGAELPEMLRIILLMILPAMILTGGSYFLFTSRDISGLVAMGLCFMIGGGIGNMVDRILYGSVTDFLHMDFVIFRTGIFNLADVSIMVGVGLIFMEFFKIRKILQV